jgi:hypothetical protein
MCRWYQVAEICYAYLVDVPSCGDDHQHQLKNSAFALSNWLTRGWTLQEFVGAVFRDLLRSGPGRDRD